MKSPNDKFEDPRLLSIPPVDVDDFLFAIAVGEGASRGQVPLVSPSAKTFWRIEPCFAGTPEDRLAAAIAEHCGADGDKFMAIMFRWMAWVRLRQKAAGRLARWRRSTHIPERDEFDQAVMETVASMPLLVASGGDEAVTSFDEVSFFGRVEQAASVKC